ncbi:MAG: amidohydrolase family protein, partial [Chloroflexi bacterium]|nr:amidohydrolase family protein [Chloroflexota bacterium]
MGQPRTLIRAARVIDGTGAPASPGAEILIKGDRVIGVGPRGSQPAAGATLLESDGTVLPGLINLHVHLAYRLDGTRDGEEPLTLIARNAAFSLRWGTTSVRDAGSRETWVQTARDAIRDGTMPGPRVWAAGRVLTTSQPEHARKAGRVADDAASLRR